MPTEIRLVATVGEDRRLDIQLPADAPTGAVEVTLRAAPDSAQQPAAPGSPARAVVRDPVQLGAAHDNPYLALISLAAEAVQKRPEFGQVWCR